MSDNASGTTFIQLTAEIVSAYVSNNSVQAGDLSGLINQVHSALTRVSSGQADLSSEPLKPAVSVKKSITADHIVCLEDGKKFKSLKRHLRTQYNMTPERGAFRSAPMASAIGESVERLLARLGGSEAAIDGAGEDAAILIGADLAVRRPDGRLVITDAGRAHLARFLFARCGSPIDPFL